MKFIISENRLKELKKKLVKVKIDHLDSYVTNSYIRKFDSFIVIEDPLADEFDEPIMEYDSYDGRLFVNKKIRSVFSGMFGDDEEKSNNFFKKWFEKKFKVEVKNFA